VGAQIVVLARASASSGWGDAHVTARPRSLGPAPAEIEFAPAKLTIPDTHAGAASRAELAERLCASSPAHWVTIAAPAGYGKTSLLVEWAVRDPRPFAWVMLDQRDDEPTVLLASLIGALGRIQPIGMVGTSAGSLWQTLVPRVCRSVAAMSGPIALALDDVQVLSRPEGIAVIETLAEHLPPGSTVAVAGRTLPDLPTGRLRAQGRLLEIGTGDLALSHEQARTLLRDAHLELTEAQVACVAGRAEGWETGLNLAARALSSRGAPVAPEDFAGDHRFVAEYLRSEHLAGLPPQQLRFLTRTAFLERLSGPLCDAVLQRRDSGRVLERLARSGTFVVPLDERGEWYRYHRLLRDMLRAELAREEPELGRVLNRRASEWCEANGAPGSALDYAHAYEDTDRAARLATAHLLRDYEAGDGATAERRLSRFSDADLLGRYPELGVVGAIIAALRGRAADAERRADALERLPRTAAGGGVDSLAPWIATLRALMCGNGAESMGADAEFALAGLAPTSPGRPTALLLTGVARLLKDDPGADEVLANTALEAARDGALSTRLLALGQRALVAMARRDLQLAGELVAAGSELTAGGDLRDYPESALFLASAARVANAQGDAAQAGSDAARAERLLPALNHAVPWLAVQARIELARVHLALADSTAARRLLVAAREIMRRRPGLGVLEQQIGGLEEQIAAGAASAGWVATLTDAELRLLPFLTTHRTFREIAEQLFVSRNTVKTQAISMYRKLDATSRSEAIARAIELGLIDARQEQPATVPPRPGFILPG
jgi:LuxR family transcriptional regulator, maltose regulon positive regulatory protein